jgi:hypothetical protein
VKPTIKIVPIFTRTIRSKDKSAGKSKVIIFATAHMVNIILVDVFMVLRSLSFLPQYGNQHHGKRLGFYNIFYRIVDQDAKISHVDK